jgi:hypothetical protein
MAKLDFRCPITHAGCQDCSLYRGRHYFLPFCKYYRNRTKDSVDPARLPPITAESFSEIFNIMEPWQSETILSIASDSDHGSKIKVTNMETDGVRYCSLEELKTLDWENPEQMRLVNGHQITSWNQLVGIASAMMEQGDEEIELYEGPRSMLLGEE